MCKGNRLAEPSGYLMVADMDVLDDIFATVGLQGSFYFRTHFSPPWSVQVPQLAGAARFHLVVRGECYVTTDDGVPARLGPGDLALIPAGRAHIISHTPDAAAAPLESVLVEAGYEGEGVLVYGGANESAATQLVCGHFAFRRGASHPLLSALPPLVVATAEDRAREPWLDDVLRLVTRRVYSDAMGSEATITRLSEIVFIELLRLGIARSKALEAILEAFTDKHIGEALQLMHQRPAHPWSVQELASAVGMSRSRFAERFTSLLQVGPMAYLTHWRLQRALVLLADGAPSVQQVATESGYRSPAAFTRAFSAKFGVSPKDYEEIAS